MRGFGCGGRLVGAFFAPVEPDSISSLASRIADGIIFWYIASLSISFLAFAIDYFLPFMRVF